MVKSKVNLVIDALMFVAMAAMGGIGFLMKWVLPPGPDRLVKYGRSVEVSWLGMDRHQFGTIHLYIAFALLGLLVLHIVLHWGQILTIYRRLIPTSTYRWAIAILLSAVCLALLAFPLFVKPEVTEGGGHGERRLHDASLSWPSAGHAVGLVTTHAEADPCADCDGCGHAAAPSASGGQAPGGGEQHAGAGHGAKTGGQVARKGQGAGRGKQGRPACEGCPGYGRAVAAL